MGILVSKFCSLKCGYKYKYLSGVYSISRKCTICGETFSVSKYDKTRTCSLKCGYTLRSIKSTIKDLPNYVQKEILDLCYDGQFEVLLSMSIKNQNFYKIIERLKRDDECGNSEVLKPSDLQSSSKNNE